MEEAREHSIPVLSTGRSTSSFMAELIYCLGEQLAPCITVHGVLVDVYGEGVMITGESGIGKSEAALELIRRGHRLVTDDVVEIRKINEHTLMGTSPEITRHFIELRGIGIIDVKTLYGVECKGKTADRPRNQARGLEKGGRVRQTRPRGRICRVSRQQGSVSFTANQTGT